MKLKDLPKIDLPRERLEKYGEQKLADYELLAILLDSGIKGTNVLTLSKQIIRHINKIGFAKVTLTDLCTIKGLGKAKASKIIAAIALAQRFSKGRPELLSAEDIWNICSDIRASKREHFVAFYINSQNELIERQIISIGTLNASLVHPREVFEPALKLSCASIIIAHNHPSGRLDPSREDVEVTKRLTEAGRLLGVELIDHVIVSKNGYLSFQQKNLL